MHPLYTIMSRSRKRRRRRHPRTVSGGRTLQRQKLSSIRGVTVGGEICGTNAEYSKSGQKRLPHSRQGNSTRAIVPSPTWTAFPSRSDQKAERRRCTQETQLPSKSCFLSKPFSNPFKVCPFSQRKGDKAMLTLLPKRPTFSRVESTCMAAQFTAESLF